MYYSKREQCRILFFYQFKPVTDLLATSMDCYRNLPFFPSQNFHLINFRVTLFSDAPRRSKIFPVSSEARERRGRVCVNKDSRSYNGSGGLK